MCNLFNESAYDQRYIYHKCDDTISLYEYNKTKTIRQMKQDLFFESEEWCSNKHDLIKMYTCQKNREYLIKENNKLYNSCYKNKKLSKVLEDLNLVEWIKKPPACFDINIKYGTFAWKDGNGYCFIGVTDDKYYVIHWNGS
jgi:hypothetical protein